MRFVLLLGTQISRPQGMDINSAGRCGMTQKGCSRAENGRHSRDSVISYASVRK